MKLRGIAFTLVLGLLVLGCKEDKKGGKDIVNFSKMEEVMAIHDEVMPSMGTIGSLVSELKPLVDSTENGLEYEAAMKELQASHKAMMDWMKGFGARFDSDEILNGKALSAEKMKWLDEEETKVKALKEQIIKSIEEAETLLGK